MNPDPEFTSMYYVITLQWTPRSGTTATITQTGLLSVPAAATRGEVVNYLLGFAREGAEIPDGRPVTVLFLSIEPNQVTGLSSEETHR